MFRSAVLAVAILCALATSSQAKPRVLHCVETGSIFFPTCNGGDFLAGVKSIKVTLHRDRHARVETGRPQGCPARRWCGCWMAAHLGLVDRALWVARNWARIGHPADGPQVGAIVVWRHHVGVIQAAEGNQILVLSGNDGRAVRERWRSTSGVIAYRVAG